MFSKFKKQSAKVSNAIKNINSTDLSEGLDPNTFVLDDLARYGMNGKIISMAFDPIQSLLAISTSQNEIRIYGNRKVEVVFQLDSASPITDLRFVKGIYLVATDNSSTITILSLFSKTILSTYRASAKITALETDPSLDWLVFGLSNGSVYFYDIDRLCLAPFRIDNLQKQLLPKERLSPVLSIKWNPRDMGSLLVTFNKCALVYSITTGDIKQSFLANSPFVSSTWHPNSLHIVSTHSDNTFVFWDANTGTLLQARTFADVDLQKSGRPSSAAKNVPIIRTEWICGSNPEETSLLFAGGDSPDGVFSLTMFDYGLTPKYSITSHERMGQYYASPQTQKQIPIPSPTQIIDFLPLPRNTPYFNGNHDPSYILVLTEDGQLRIIDYPTCQLNFSASILPSNLEIINPNLTFFGACSISRVKWLGMLTSTKSNNLLKGGISNSKQTRVFSSKKILISGHELGIVRLWDNSSSELDETENIQINVGDILGDWAPISQVSFSGETTEIIVSNTKNDVILLSFGKNRKYGASSKGSPKFVVDKLIDISSFSPKIKEGFMPISALRSSHGAISCLKNSDIGFASIAYASGVLIVIDRRGPAIIYQDNISKFVRSGDYVVTMEYSIMEYQNEGYSSILLFCGTRGGDLLVFKIFPADGGRFIVEFASGTKLSESSIENLIPIHSETGVPTVANLAQLQQLGSGIIIPGYICVQTKRELRIINLMKNKIAHRIFNNGNIISAGLSCVPELRGQVEIKRYVIIVMFDNSTASVLSVPELKDISSMKLPLNRINPQFASQSKIDIGGFAVIRFNEKEIALVNFLGKGLRLDSFPPDTLFNDHMFIPLRPVVGALQWARGTKMISVQDLNYLLAGPNRRKPTTQESELAYNISPESGNSTIPAEVDEFAYQKPIRGASVGVQSGIGSGFRSYMRTLQTGVENMEETANSYANQMSEAMGESVETSKSSVYSAALKSKFGF